MKIFINEKKENNDKSKMLKNALEITLFVFSMCAVTLALFFGSLQEIEKVEYKESSEYKEVFSELGLYDFLEIDECENVKTNGEVSENNVNSQERGK